MPLRYGSRCRPRNLREGTMVPLLCTCLLEVGPKLRPPEFWRLFLLVTFGAQQLRWFGDVRRNPPRLVPSLWFI
jgi:hypothetical protein